VERNFASLLSGIDIEDIDIDIDIDINIDIVVYD
jgi:hypothetical protein